MEHDLEEALDNIIQLAKQNPEFNRELRKRLQLASSANVVSKGSSVTEDVAAIRAALEIRANTSINYAFVKEQRLRDQLIVDNLRMENAALNLKDDEDTRFYTFCVNSFYQIENILNYFYHKKFPQKEDLLSEIENATKGEMFPFKRKGNENNISDITVVNKINAFCNAYIQDNHYKIIINTIRKVRNEGAHRCMIVKKDNNDESFFHKFLTERSFIGVRSCLIKLVEIIKIELNNKNSNGKNVQQHNTIVGEIKNLLPSSCFVSFGGKSIQLPYKLFDKVKHLKNGDKVLITTSYNIIVDVLPQT